MSSPSSYSPTSSISSQSRSVSPRAHSPLQAAQFNCLENPQSLDPHNNCSLEDLKNSSTHHNFNYRMILYRPGNQEVYTNLILAQIVKVRENSENAEEKSNLKNLICYPWIDWQEKNLEKILDALIDNKYSETPGENERIIDFAEPYPYSPFIEGMADSDSFLLVKYELACALGWVGAVVDEQFVKIKNHNSVLIISHEAQRTVIENIRQCSGDSSILAQCLAKKPQFILGLIQKIQWSDAQSQRNILNLLVAYCDNEDEKATRKTDNIYKVTLKYLICTSNISWDDINLKLIASLIMRFDLCLPIGAESQSLEKNSLQHKVDPDLLKKLDFSEYLNSLKYKLFSAWHYLGLNADAKYQEFFDDKNTTVTISSAADLEDLHELRTRSSSLLHSHRLTFQEFLEEKINWKSPESQQWLLEYVMGILLPTAVDSDSEEESAGDYFKHADRVLTAAIERQTATWPLECLQLQLFKALEKLCSNLDFVLVIPHTLLIKQILENPVLKWEEWQPEDILQICRFMALGDIYLDSFPHPLDFLRKKRALSSDKQLVVDFCRVLGRFGEEEQRAIESEMQQNKLQYVQQSKSLAGLYENLTIIALNPGPNDLDLVFHFLLKIKIINYIFKSDERVEILAGILSKMHVFVIFSYCQKLIKVNPAFGSRIRENPAISRTLRDELFIMLQGIEHYYSQLNIDRINFFISSNFTNLCIPFYEDAKNRFCVAMSSGFEQPYNENFNPRFIHIHYTATGKELFLIRYKRDISPEQIKNYNNWLLPSCPDPVKKIEALKNIQIFTLQKREGLNNYQEDFVEVPFYTKGLENKMPYFLKKSLMTYHKYNRNLEILRKRDRGIFVSN